MDKNIKHKIVWAVFIAVIFAAYLISLVDLHHFSLIADRAQIKKLFIGFLFLLTANIIRAFRFRKLDYSRNGLKQWLIINKLYNFMTATLPGGVGDAATAYLLKRYSLLGILSALRLLLVSRIMDIGGMSALLLCVALLIRGGVQYKESVILLSGVLVVISMAAIVPATERFILKLLQKLPGQNRIMNKTREKMRELISLSEENSRGNTITITLCQTTLSIVATAFSMHFILLSYESGFTIMQSFYCVALYAVFQLIPIQGIAGIGTQPARWLIALNLAGYEGPDVAAMSIMLYGTFYIFIVIMGVFALLVWVMSRKSGILGRSL